MSDALTRQVHALMRETSERVILPRYHTLSAGEIVTKSVRGEMTDVVTIADREAEALLSEGLARLLPEAKVVGEEAAFTDPLILERLNDDLCWIVDPLDGTNNFAAGQAPFGILIALADRGVTQFGWIYDCLSGRFCHAALGKGAFMGGEKVRARSTGQSPPVAANSLIYVPAERRDKMQALIAPHFTLVDIPRCAAEQYPRLVLGDNDVAMFQRTLPWDHAAGVLFVNEAGGKAARPDGSAYRVDAHDRLGLIAAASEPLWEQFADRVARG